MSGRVITTAFLAGALGVGGAFLAHPEETKPDESARLDKDFSPTRWKSGSPAVSLLSPDAYDRPAGSLIDLTTECIKDAPDFLAPAIPQDNFLQVAATKTSEPMSLCDDTDYTVELIMPLTPLQEALESGNYHGLTLVFDRALAGENPECPEIHRSQIGVNVDWSPLSETVTVSTTVSNASHAAIEKVGCAAIRAKTP